jgi:hypothetical protein
MMYKTSISTDYISILMLQSLFDAKFGQKSTAADASSPRLDRGADIDAHGLGAAAKRRGWLAAGRPLVILLRS